jgi:hypothetical protein
MGEIISSKELTNGNIIYKIILEDYEALSLKNAINNINLFSSDLFNNENFIMKRGNEGVTKYFEIPFNLRFRKKKFHNRLTIQKLETYSKTFYIYVIKKDKLWSL